MSTDKRNKYFQELSRNLRHEGLTVKPETEEGLLPVELDGQRLCLVLDTGVVRYWKEDVADDHRSAALNRVTDITKITAEYMRQMEAAPQLTASGLTGDYCYAPHRVDNQRKATLKTTSWGAFLYGNQ